jgi:hypothetical protein
MFFFMLAPVTRSMSASSFHRANVLFSSGEREILLKMTLNGSQGLMIHIILT